MKLSSFKANIVLLSAAVIHSTITTAPLLSKTMTAIMVLCLIYKITLFAFAVVMLFLCSLTTNQHLRLRYSEEIEAYKEKLKSIFKTNRWYLEFPKKQILVYVFAVISAAIGVNWAEYILLIIAFDLASFWLFFQHVKVINNLK